MKKSRAASYIVSVLLGAVVLDMAAKTLNVPADWIPAWAIMGAVLGWCAVYMKAFEVQVHSDSSDDFSTLDSEPPITLAERIRYYAIDIDGEEQVLVPTRVMHGWASEVDALEAAAKAPT